MSKDPTKLIERYGGKNEQELIKEQENLETEVAVQAQALDQEIQNFSSKTDEMITPDGKVLAIVKRPTSAQFNRFAPPELGKYKEKPESIPQEKAEAYMKDIFKLMEELIVTPHHTAEEWENQVGDDFIALFQAHMMKLRQQMADTVKRFLQPT